MNDMDEQLFEDGVTPYLLLESELESIYENQTINTEYFFASCIVSTGSSLAFLNPIHYNCSIVSADSKHTPKIIQEPFSFCYFPNDKFFLTHSDWHAGTNDTKLISMSVYNNYKILSKKSTDYRKLGLYQKPRLSGIETSYLHDAIKKGREMRLVFVTSSNQKVSCRVRLPMLNQSGEYYIGTELVSSPMIFNNNLSEFVDTLKVTMNTADKSIQSKIFPRFSDDYETIKEKYFNSGLKPILPLVKNWKPANTDFIPAPTLLSLHESASKIIVSSIRGQNQANIEIDISDCFLLII